MHEGQSKNTLLHWNVKIDMLGPDSSWSENKWNTETVTAARQLYVDDWIIRALYWSVWKNETPAGAPRQTQIGISDRTLGVETWRCRGQGTQQTLRTGPGTVAIENTLCAESVSGVGGGRQRAVRGGEEGVETSVPVSRAPASVRSPRR